MTIPDNLLRGAAPLARELWLETLPQKEEVPEPSVSAAFEQRMDVLLRRGRRMEQRRKSLRTAGRAAAVVLLAAAISFGCLMTVEAFREKAVRVITKVYREFTQYNYSGTQEDATLPELHINSLPAGMEVLYDEASFGITRQIHCENRFGQFLNLNIDVFSKLIAGTECVDTEDASVSTRIIREKEVTVISKNDWHVLQWEESGAIFMITSNIELNMIEAFLEEDLIVLR